MAPLGLQGRYRFVCTRVDSSFIVYIKKDGYESQISSLVDVYGTGEAVVSSLSLRLIHSDRQLRAPFWIPNFVFWSKNIEFDFQLRTSKRLPVFAGWKNVKMYATPSSQRYSAYVSFILWLAD